MAHIPAGAVAVAFLLATAGCNTPLADGDAPATTETLTPAPLPGGSTADADASGYPPGVGPDGVTDAARLVGAHDDVLADASHTVRLTTTREYPNGSVQTGYERVLEVAGPDRYHYTLRVRGEEGDLRIERWRDGDAAFVSETTGGETTARRLEPAPPPTLVTRSELARVLDLAPSRLVGTQPRNGSTLYRLEGGPSDVSRLSNLSYDALVDERGFVVSYTVTYDVSEGSRTRSVRVSATFESVGETTVERPSWVDQVA